jgi:hypothetical protein
MEALVNALTTRVASAEERIEALEKSFDSRLSTRDSDGSVSALSLGALALALIAGFAFARPRNQSERIGRS